MVRCQRGRHSRAAAKGTPARDQSVGKHSRLVIGVAGGSGSGKTTVVRRIVERSATSEVTVLDHDRYYRDRNDLRLEERAALNYDHPDSLETDLLVRHVDELRAGRRVEAPLYDFARHARRRRPRPSRRAARSSSKAS